MEHPLRLASRSVAEALAQATEAATRRRSRTLVRLILYSAFRHKDTKAQSISKYFFVFLRVLATLWQICTIHLALTIYLSHKSHGYPAIHVQYIAC